MHTNSEDWPELASGKNPLIKGMIRESFKDYLKKRKSISPLTSLNYKESTEDVVVRILMSSELVTLTNPVTQEANTGYQYAFLLAEMIRQETGADFSLIPISLINKSREPLEIVTMTRVFSDIKNKEGIYIVEMPGNVIYKLLDDSFKAQNNLAFAGLSIEKNEKSFKILPWKDSFEEDNLYKVAINENFVHYLNQLNYSNLKKVKRFCDIRRTFIDGLRNVNGKVELKRAFY
jgi:hypothetical protein